jgi:NAD(P)-dependent dehydrogenase (short-subunit alcohol dehydrogenase family)
MKFSPFDSCINQWSTVPPVETVDLSAKTVLVVGANVGIGLEASKHFARMQPARLIIACRNESKGKAALAGMYHIIRINESDGPTDVFSKKLNRRLDIMDTSSG